MSGEGALSGPAKVVMEYHHEPEGWWADSDDLPGFTAAGATFDEVRELAHSGAEFYLERPVEVEDRLPEPPRGRRLVLTVGPRPVTCSLGPAPGGLGSRRGLGRGS